MNVLNSGPQVIERPNDYDHRQMKAIRQCLQKALFQIDLAIERDARDGQYRAIWVNTNALKAARLAVHLHRRLAVSVGKEPLR